ncbi:F-box protein At3g58530-like isoform X3 [Zingiber officinale]|uniref:F-box protein At3g58530-like isoform X3 n=1 Tax=Zingiber officinale TaxID=94328 RepID=UPI001C4B8DFC|nr:F-box protein At3g58530-like isoform X3 [Zingiber officinale]
MAGTGESSRSWERETVPMVMTIVSPMLAQRDVYSLLLVSPWCYRALLSVSTIWEVLDLHEMSKAGERLRSALLLGKVLQGLQHLNLNGCQKISDVGIEAITSCCPQLREFYLYWNVRLTNVGITHIVRNCRELRSLNLSGCKNISDHCLHLIGDNCQKLQDLDITRCTKLTDRGLQQILLKCSLLQRLNLYALSSLTDAAYKKIACLSHLTFLDLCGAQNLTDEGLSCIAGCKNLASLNLTWCVRVTDMGVIAIAEGCRSLELLSLHGIISVTDACLEALSKFSSNSLMTLDVNGCVGIKKRSREHLLQLFPLLRCFKVHS